MCVMYVCVCVFYTKRGTDLVAEAWILEYPALEGVLAKLRVCLCASVGKCVCGHKAVGMLRWQMALLHCRATLANRGRTGRRWERRRRWDVSQRRERDG